MYATVRDNCHNRRSPHLLGKNAVVGAIALEGSADP